MLVAEGGSSTNSGTEQGNILTVEGSHVNTGTSIWNGVTVADKGKGENAGKLDVGSVFDVLGEFVNKGAEAVLDATKTAVTNVAGILRNEGTANYDDMTIADGGKSENAGFEKGDILTVPNTATAEPRFGTTLPFRTEPLPPLKKEPKRRSMTLMWLRVTVQTRAKLMRPALRIPKLQVRLTIREPPTTTI